MTSGGSAGDDLRSDPQAKTISFMRNYGEPYEWLKEAFLDWEFIFVSAFMYCHDRDLLDENALKYSAFAQIKLASCAIIV